MPVCPAFFLVTLLFAVCFFAEIFEPVPLSEALFIFSMDHLIRPFPQEETKRGLLHIDQF